MKQPTSEQTRLFQEKMFPQNGATGQNEQSLHGKSLARKDVRSQDQRGLRSQCGHYPSERHVRGQVLLYEVWHECSF